MGYVIRIVIYDKEVTYFVLAKNRLIAKKIAFDKFKSVTPLNKKFNTFEKFEKYYWIDSGFRIEVVTKVDEIIN